MSDFLPCPSCGSAENLRLIRHIAAWRSGVICQCGMNATSVERWNTRALPAVQPDAAAIREAALREVLNAIWRDDLGEEATAMYNQIVALLDRPAHVNETPKSEHDAANMLTPATKGERDD